MMGPQSVQFGAVTRSSVPSKLLPMKRRRLQMSFSSMSFRSNLVTQISVMSI